MLTEPRRCLLRAFIFSSCSTPPRHSQEHPFPVQSKLAADNARAPCAVSLEQLCFSAEVAVFENSYVIPERSQIFDVYFEPICTSYI